MNIDIKPGKYVVAVSGGVDSVVLLDLLTKEPELGLVVAHFDHGMRPDSGDDRVFVQELASKYGLVFVYEAGKLGAKASEESARKARYEFLEKTKEEARADAIITAHHQDDLLETAIINLLRGTGRRGLTALKSDKIIRPLLDVPKKELVEYAKGRKLPWREDPTNQDTNYLRNYVRHKLLPKFNAAERQQLLTIINKLSITNTDLDTLALDILKTQPNTQTLDRDLLTMLPHNAAKELMAVWLRQNGITSYDKQTLERLVRAAKTYGPGKRADINNRNTLEVQKDRLVLEAG